MMGLAALRAKLEIVFARRKDIVGVELELNWECLLFEGEKKNNCILRFTYAIGTQIFLTLCLSPVESALHHDIEGGSCPLKISVKKRAGCYILLCSDFPPSNSNPNNVGLCSSRLQSEGYTNLLASMRQSYTCYSKFLPVLETG